MVRLADPRWPLTTLFTAKTLPFGEPPYCLRSIGSTPFDIELPLFQKQLLLLTCAAGLLLSFAPWRLQRIVFVITRIVMATMISTGMIAPACALPDEKGHAGSPASSANIENAMIFIAEMRGPGHSNPDLCSTRVAGRLSKATAYGASEISFVDPCVCACETILDNLRSGVESIVLDGA